MIKNEEMPAGIRSVRGCRDECFDGVPIMKPKIPIQADTRWIMGLSRAVPSLAPSLARKAIRVKRTKKMNENPRAMAMKAGVVAVGADNQRDASLGRAERSNWGVRIGLDVAMSMDKPYLGFRTGIVQLMDAALFVREQDPGMQDKHR